MHRLPENYIGVEYPNEMLSIIKSGLKSKTKPKKILIAGAGISGLVAASLLKQAGHQVAVIEGNSRIGGRIYTVREPFTNGNYLDLGAMRIPNTHVLAFEYIRRFRLRTNIFNHSTQKDLIFVNNIHVSVEAYEKNPDILGFPVREWEKGKTAAELFLIAVQPFMDLYENSSLSEQIFLSKQFGKYSMETFLKKNPLGPSLSSTAINMINVMLGIEGFKELAFISILSVTFPLFKHGIKFYEITGGNDNLPYAFTPELHSEILLNEKIEKITQTREGVLFQTKNQITGEFHTYSGDYAILTIPFTAMQFVEISPYSSISFKKRQAIHELQNIPAIKIGIEFKHRFWEANNQGNAISDLPIRFSYIPSHDLGKSGPGVLLASYCWGHDALLWNSLYDKEIIYYALKELAKVYGNVVYQEYMQGFSFDWSRNPFSAGCLTLFSPTQQAAFGKTIQQTEGRLHFAGEHASSFPGWIEGAIESGIRAAHEVSGIQ
ncbi:flavin monoamine oxidase family protein [Cytobacillus purgationiresistens]|uniref:Monoamine oxidase n=1 Tax=Cytobacillus purgationiresistens TaxID=863449 RepID=A0ABU0AFW8_9BACI|nr:flavin monoamine oxidase family protein [Cytobacillus purgationiresistens]MDQ0269764.1 monoamine oxidase [Cytobacillus purgationiresistens]